MKISQLNPFIVTGCFTEHNGHTLLIVPRVFHRHCATKLPQHVPGLMPSTVNDRDSLDFGPVNLLDAFAVLTRVQENGGFGVKVGLEIFRRRVKIRSRHLKMTLIGPIPYLTR